MGVRRACGADDDNGSLQSLMGKWGGRAQWSGHSLKITSLENNHHNRVMLKEVLQREYYTYMYLHF